MGKRKERRLAAKIGAGRRVKLDLLPEPPGDLGGSPENEAGGEVESKLDGSLPGSPSSSGEQPVNPLLLLGQYSDDELQNESKETTLDLDGNSGADDEQLKDVSDEHGEVGTSNGKEGSACKDGVSGLNADTASTGPLQVAVSNVLVESDVVGSPDSMLKTTNTVEDSAHAPSDVKLCWKMVIHEESNSYYYWNTITGETSWEVPAELAQARSSYDGQNDKVTQKSEDGLGDAITQNIIEYGNGAIVTSVGFDSGSQATQFPDRTGDNNQLIGNLGGHGGADQDNVTLMNYSSFVPSHVPVGGWSSAAHVSNFYGPGPSSNQDGSSAFDLPSQLLKQSESLLEKLKSLGGSDFNSNQQHAWASKYISEIEIRLSDFKSLLSFGSTISPFWEHSQRQLKRLEDAVNIEIGSYVEFELQKLPSAEELREAELEVERAESQVNMDREKTIGSVKNKCDPFTVDKQMIVHVPGGDPVELSSDMITGPKQVLVQAKEQSVPETTAHTVSQQPEFGAQDVDMDVDMEVEDTGPQCGNVIHAPKERPNNVCTLELTKTYPADHQPSMSCPECVLPPEEGEWVPPPPPDDEEIPPPPPDDPPPPLPPSYPVSVHTVPFTGDCTLTYPHPNYSFYLQHEPAVLAGQPMYYQAVSASQAEETAGPANVIGPTAYYGLPDGGLPTMPVDAQSSGYQASSFVSSYVPMSSERYETASGQSVMASYTTVDVSGSLPGVGAEAGTSQPSSTNVSVSASTIAAPATAAAGATLNTCSAEVEAAASAAAKPQPKAQRVKRKSVTVASSLRSNKKVSSMVDKWMAAKEELEEADEEEARSALDLLEKKRQREIEEWRAQQIASGEARGNANFQPLGGDWRERVKRRRAEKSAVTASSKEEERSGAELEQGPDLSELSIGLPHGWQVFWDESSRQVYYGNGITSETTWTRPIQ